MLGRGLAGIGALVDGHKPHQALNPLAGHRVSLGVEPRRQYLAADQIHDEPEIIRAGQSRAAVDRSPADIQQAALAAIQGLRRIYRFFSYVSQMGRSLLLAISMKPGAPPLRRLRSIDTYIRFI